MSEDGYHILIRIIIKVMDFVSLVEEIGKRIWRGRIDDSRRNDVRHIAMIAIFRDGKLRIRIKLTHSRKVYITAIFVSLVLIGKNW